MSTMSYNNTSCPDISIEKTLRLLGLNNSYKGYNFLIYGIKLVIENPKLLTYICKGLYAEIAIYNNTTINCVERNIRTVKEVIWSSASQEILSDIFGDLYHQGIPSNAVFIDMLAYYIKKLPPD